MLYCLYADTSLLQTSFAGQENSTQNAEFELLFWQTVKDSEDIDMFRAYLKKYPSGNFVELAKLKIKALQNAPSRPAPGRGTRHGALAQAEAPGPLLRNTPARVEPDDVKKMLRKHNFHDWYLNHNGDFKNKLQDNKNGTVRDDATDLVWEKVGSYYKLTLKEAYRYIDGLNRKKFAGRSDWRLPTVEELASLIEKSPQGNYRLYIDSIFGSEQDGNWLDSCWTSDTYRPSHGADHTAWVVSFEKCGVKPAHWYDMADSNQNDPTYDKNYVRAVCSVK